VRALLLGRVAVKKKKKKRWRWRRGRSEWRVLPAGHKKRMESEDDDDGILDSCEPIADDAAAVVDQCERADVKYDELPLYNVPLRGSDTRRTMTMLAHIGGRILEPRRRQFWDCVSAGAAAAAEKHRNNRRSKRDSAIAIAHIMGIPAVIAAGYGAICVAKTHPGYLTDYLRFVFGETPAWNTDDDDSEDLGGDFAVAVDADLGWDVALDTDNQTGAGATFTDYIAPLMVEALHERASVGEVCIPLMNYARRRRISHASIKRIMYAMCTSNHVPMVEGDWNLSVVCPEYRLWELILELRSDGIQLLYTCLASLSMPHSIRAVLRTWGTRSTNGNMQPTVKEFARYVAACGSNLEPHEIESIVKALDDDDGEDCKLCISDYIRLLAGFIQSGQAASDDPKRCMMQYIARYHQKRPTSRIPSSWVRAAALATDERTHAYFLSAILQEYSDRPPVAEEAVITYVGYMLVCHESPDLLEKMSVRFVKREWAEAAIARCKGTTVTAYLAYFGCRRRAAWARGDILDSKEMNKELAARRKRNIRLLRDRLDQLR